MVAVCCKNIDQFRPSSSSKTTSSTEISIREFVPSSPTNGKFGVSTFKKELCKLNVKRVYILEKLYDRRSHVCFATRRPSECRDENTRRRNEC